MIEDKIVIPPVRLLDQNRSIVDEFKTLGRLFKLAPNVPSNFESFNELMKSVREARRRGRASHSIVFGRQE